MESYSTVHVVNTFLPTITFCLVILQPSASDHLKCFVFVYSARIYILFSLKMFHNRKSWVFHSDQKTRAFGELHNKESSFTGNHLWEQRICRATNGKMNFATHILTTIHGHLQSPSNNFFSFWRRRHNVFTCCWRLAGQNTFTYPQIVHTFFESVLRGTHDCVHCVTPHELIFSTVL